MEGTVKFVWKTPDDITAPFLVLPLQSWSRGSEERQSFWDMSALSPKVSGQPLGRTEHEHNPAMWGFIFLSQVQTPCCGCLQNTLACLIAHLKFWSTFNLLPHSPDYPWRWPDFLSHSQCPQEFDSGHSTSPRREALCVAYHDSDRVTAVGAT